MSLTLLDELHRISDYGPEHLPGEIELIENFSLRYPELVQVACFDTAFNVSMRRVAKLLPAAAQSRVIPTHLGHGASLAAVHDGRYVDTGMGFIPGNGLPMGT